MLSDFYKAEADRAFNVLGCEVGLLQNLTDADGWYRQGIMTDDERREYIEYAWATARKIMRSKA